MVRFFNYRNKSILADDTPLHKLMLLMKNPRKVVKKLKSKKLSGFDWVKETQDKQE